MPAPRSERGSAVVDFVLVLVVLLPLVLGILHVGLVLHVRNTLTSAATEGARYAALAGSSAEAGVQRTRALIGAAISAEYADDVSASRMSVGGVPAIAVSVRTTLPVVGLLGPERGLEVTGHAALETVD